MDVSPFVGGVAQRPWDVFFWVVGSMAASFPLMDDWKNQNCDGNMVPWAWDILWSQRLIGLLCRSWYRFKVFFWLLDYSLFASLCIHLVVWKDPFATKNPFELLKVLCKCGFCQTANMLSSFFYHEFIRCRCVFLKFFESTAMLLS